MPAARAVESPPERSELCRSVLEALPDWFGIEEAVRRYIRDVAELPTFAVDRHAFLSLKLHSEVAAEIYVMGVRPELQGQGLGTALVEAAESFLRSLGVEYLQVKTLGPSNPSTHYARTRRFYAARGFRPLEELQGFWDEENPVPDHGQAPRRPGYRAPVAVTLRHAAIPSNRLLLGGWKRLRSAVWARVGSSNRLLQGPGRRGGWEEQPWR